MGVELLINEHKTNVDSEKIYHFLNKIYLKFKF